MSIYQDRERKFQEYSEAILKVPALRNPWTLASVYMSEAGYRTAPASTRFHLCVKGGLLIHSVGVCELALRWAGEVPVRYSLETIMATALLHDIGKCGLYEESTGLRERYVSNPRFIPGKDTPWNKPYDYQETDPVFNVRDLSGLLVARWGFPWEMVQAVLIHDGAYSPQNADYAGKNSPLAALIMAADTFCAQQLETKAGVVPLED